MFVQICLKMVHRLKNLCSNKDVFTSLWIISNLSLSLMPVSFGLMSSQVVDLVSCLPGLWVHWVIWGNPHTSFSCSQEPPFTIQQSPWMKRSFQKIPELWAQAWPFFGPPRLPIFKHFTQIFQKKCDKETVILSSLDSNLSRAGLDQLPMGPRDKNELWAPLNLPHFSHSLHIQPFLIPAHHMSTFCRAPFPSYPDGQTLWHHRTTR